MAAIIAIMCICSILSSSSLAGAFSVGAIPGTGPKVVQDGNLENLKTYIKLSDQLVEKMEDQPESNKWDIVTTFLSDNDDKLKSLCVDVKKFSTFFNNNKSKNILTISGIKSTRDFIIEYMGGEEEVEKIEMLINLKNCPSR